MMPLIIRMIEKSISYHAFLVQKIDRLISWEVNKFINNLTMVLTIMIEIIVISYYVCLVQKIDHLIENKVYIYIKK